MTGTDQAGEKIVVSTSGRTRKSPSVSELTGLGEQAERDAAIIALALKNDWSTDRLSGLFNISVRHVQRIIKEFKADFADEDLGCIMEVC